MQTVISLEEQGGWIGEQRTKEEPMQVQISLDWEHLMESRIFSDEMVTSLTEGDEGQRCDDLSVSTMFAICQPVVCQLWFGVAFLSSKWHLLLLWKVMSTFKSTTKHWSSIWSHQFPIYVVLVFGPGKKTMHQFTSLPGLALGRDSAEHQFYCDQHSQQDLSLIENVQSVLKNRK